MLRSKTVLAALYYASTSIATVTAEPIELGDFVTRFHLTAGTLVAHTDRRLEIRNFLYDGLGPAAFFWGDSSPKPSTNGYLLPDEEFCGKAPLGSADGESSVFLEIPAGQTLADYAGGSISVWCEAVGVNFGEVLIPEDVSNVKASDGSELTCGPPPTQAPIVPEIAKTPPNFNCEPLNDDFQVRWALEGDLLSVELVGRIDDISYLAFGPSGRDNRTHMTGSDVVVVDLFQDEFRAIDYYMGSRAQCSNGNGVCPDTEADRQNDVSDVSGERDFGVTLVRYKRPLLPTDAAFTVGAQKEPVDREIGTAGPRFISWAIGPISTTTGFPNYHSIAVAKENVTLDFGREVLDSCDPLVVVEGNTEPTAAPAPIPAFVRPTLYDVTEFTARIGPSGGARGYQAITDTTAWGIAWYINDYLIPELVLRRGTTYRFKINGGDDPLQDSVYHPFYLTTSPVGGYAQINATQRLLETPLAGIDNIMQTEDGVLQFTATLEAPLCQYRSTLQTAESLDNPETSYQDFFATLDTSCQDDTAIVNNAAILEFTPDETTPDTIYYHCVTHRNLGWKIQVVDGDAPSPTTPAPTSAPTPSSGTATTTKRMLMTTLSSIMMVAVLVL